MKRSTFIRSLAGISTLSLISFDSFVQYKKVYLKHVFLRGFSYYDGPKIIDDINKSGQLEMVREPNNKYDKRAIAFYFNEQKIGYLPKESNKTLSILMDTQLLEFHCEITHVRNDVSDWEKIKVAVYALKEIKNQNDLKRIEPYTALQTPTYYSLLSEEETLTRILIENENIPTNSLKF